MSNKQDLLSEKSIKTQIDDSHALRVENLSKNTMILLQVG